MRMLDEWRKKGKERRGNEAHGGRGHASDEVRGSSQEHTPARRHETRRKIEGLHVTGEAGEVSFVREGFIDEGVQDFARIDADVVRAAVKAGINGPTADHGNRRICHGRFIRVPEDGETPACPDRAQGK